MLVETTLPAPCTLHPACTLPAEKQMMATTMATKDPDQAYEEAMDDVHTRFILNLPDEELQSAPRIFFQLEQAWWFYDDFICDGAAAAAAAEAAAGGGGGGKKKRKKKKQKAALPDPLPRFKHVKPFALAMFRFSPLLAPMLPRFEDMYEEFSAYKRSISTYGTILLNREATRVVLCRVYKGKAWTLPGGKVNQNESGKDASSRETYEETGFDPQCEWGLCATWRERRERGEAVEELARDDDVDAPSDEEEEGGGKLLPWEPLRDGDKLVYTENDTKKRRTCYVCRGVPETFPFEPVARKEVSQVAWHDLTNLPKPSYAVMPFMAQLKRWIKKDNRKRGIDAREVSRAGSRSKHTDHPHDRNSSRGKPREPLDDLGLTPFFSDDGNAPWEEMALEKNSEERSTERAVTPSQKSTHKDKKEKQRKQKQKRPNSRSGSRSKGSRPDSRGKRVAEDDPLVTSALATPGERNRWTEDEMFAANEQITGREIAYDGNPHDFAEKGFDVVGEGRVDPHAFRVVGGAFMNSEQGDTLSAPPERGALQPLVNAQQGRRGRSGTRGSSVSGLTNDLDHEGMGDPRGDDDGDLALTPFFSGDGKAPWEEDTMGGLLSGLDKGEHATPPPMRSSQETGHSDFKGLALLNHLRQGNAANEVGENGIGLDQQQQAAPSSSTPSKSEKKDVKKEKKKKDEKNRTTVVDDNVRGEAEDSTDWFMTDKDITIKSQKEKLSILPPTAFSVAANPLMQQAVSSQNCEHLEWMKHWVKRLPQAGPTKEFGDFRLDVNLIVEAMTTI